MKFGTEKFEGKVVLHSFCLKNFFLSYEWDEVNNVLDLGPGRFWATDPKMKLELSEIIEEDLQGFREIAIPEDGRWANWDDIHIDSVIITEGRHSEIVIEYGFKCGRRESSEGEYRLIAGYRRELKGTNFSWVNGEPDDYTVTPLKRRRKEQELVIYW